MTVRIFTFSLSLLLFTSSLVAQESATSLPATDDDAIKISTTLIQIDATVTDKKGRIVTNLRPEDFEVYENGKKQKLTNFSFVKLAGDNNETSTVQVSVSPQTKGKVAIPVPPAKASAAQVRRTYAIVVDDLGLSYGSMDLVKEAMRKFVNEQVQEGDLVAVLRTGSSGIGAVQSFTTDKRLLMAAVEKLSWNGQSRNGVNMFESIQPSMKEQMSGSTNSNGQEKSVAGTEEDAAFLKQEKASRDANFAIGTLGALRYIIRGMDRLPGRKSMMVFSEGFQMLEIGNPSSVQTRIYDELRSIADLAGRSSVVIYTLDPRGVQFPGMMLAEDNTWGQRTGVFGSPADRLSGQLQARNDQFLESQFTLRFLADETGGVPYVGRNDVGTGMQRAIDDQSGFYLLAYEPDSESFDPAKLRFNKLVIKVKNKDLKIRYRRGYYGMADPKPSTTQPTAQQRIAEALISPFAAEGVPLALYPIYTNDAENGNMIRALVHIDAKSLTFAPDEGGKMKTSFVLAAKTYGDNGVVVDQVANTYNFSLAEDSYRAVMTNGLIYELPVPVKRPGAYQFRVALLDTAKDAVGSASQFVEVPDFAAKQLALSNLVVDSFSAADWARVKRGEQIASSGRSPLTDSTLRQFKRGTVLRYGYVVYNGAGDDVKLQTRLIRDGKVVIETTPEPFSATGRPDPLRVENSGAVTIGSNLTAGNYVLQIVAVRTNSKGKTTSTSRWLDFTVVD